MNTGVAPLQTWVGTRGGRGARVGRIPLLCFPHAGGAASSFRLWGEGGTHVDYWPVRLPGREERVREKGPDSVTELATAVSQALEPVFRRPYALFGHSFGGIVAHEVARINEERGYGPRHLFLSACAHPRDREPLPPDLDEDHALLAWLTALGGIPAAVLSDPELLAYALGVVRYDLQILAEHQLEASLPLTCDITVLYGQADTRVSALLAKSWAAETHGAFELLGLKGGHFYLFESRNISRIRSIFDRTLA